MKVHIGLAGLPYEIELRFWLACKLLMSSSTPVQLHKWDGKPCDILVTDLDSEQGQVAYEMAIHGDTRVLFLSKDTHIEQPAGTRIDKHATASAIAKTLENMVMTAPRNKHAAVDGLLGICLLQGGNGHEVLTSNGRISVILRDNGRRVYASSREELESAKQYLLDDAWASIPVTAPCEHQYEGLVWESLDSFLVAACLRHRDKLAMISDATYRLSVWPDFVAFPDNREALRMSSALYRKNWRVAELAEHCGVSVATANAFCWAMQASGALRLDDSTETPRVNQANKPLPLVQRVVRHFGLKAPQTHA
ncbi:hypothetical protein [Dyella nitratireducens]|uniref:Uncharacterized protein n=1 Tax=Dyella nitratireducens TaxID=1849580 RepID=A0ABQ1GIR3_9GAMM|nr:hypothetical protein [Dyella nitratireducens]GGA44230.1 hypothetical protein GCM10010981_36720 [Dyella nitratireducens]GLQ41771.1 hypothetical protein GCM10007902_16210 [Dyella nitratireducens]